MQYFPFSERRELLVFCCTHILDGDEYVCLVNHHFDDNNWVFLCNCEHTDLDAVIVSIGELCDVDSSLEELCDLPVGHCAVRTDKNAPWEISRIPGEKYYDVNLTEPDCDCGHCHNN